MARLDRGVPGIWAVHSAYLVVDAITARWRTKFFKVHQSWDGAGRWLGCLLTFHLVAIGMVFFRAPRVPQALWLLGHLFSGLGSSQALLWIMVDSVPRGLWRRPGRIRGVGARRTLPSGPLAGQNSARSALGSMVGLVRRNHLAVVRCGVVVGSFWLVLADHSSMKFFRDLLLTAPSAWH